jgi:lipoprotein-anchoring transpeptidase ErfK/SrfK
LKLGVATIVSIAGMAAAFLPAQAERDDGAYSAVKTNFTGGAILTRSTLAERLDRQPDLPDFMEGEPGIPLGARALYLGAGEYRIHGTSQPWTIGQVVSSGCIRLTNEDVIDLFGRAKVGAKVIMN